MTGVYTLSGKTFISGSSLI